MEMGMTTSNPVRVVVVSSYDSIISCGPVPVLNFMDHRFG
jgi:hypothetical protein